MYINKILNYNVNLNHLNNNSGTNNVQYTGQIHTGLNADTFSSNISFGAESGYVLKRNYPDDKNLELYLDSISKYKTLSHEKTKELFKEMSKGGKDAEKIREQLINANLRLVLYAVKKSPHNPAYSVLDMIQTGNQALMEAVDKYDYKKKCAFSTYALPHIRSSIRREMQENLGTIRVPGYMREEALKLEKKEETLTAALSQPPTTAQLAKAMRMTVEQIKALKRIIPQISDVNMRVYGKEDQNNFAVRNNFDATNDKECFLGETLSGEVFPTGEDVMSKRDVHEALIERLKALGDRELFIISKRYELNGEDAKTYSELGRMAGLTGVRIQQIERKALKKLALSENAKILKPYLRDFD